MYVLIVLLVWFGKTVVIIIAILFAITTSKCQLKYTTKYISKKHT